MLRGHRRLIATIAVAISGAAVVGVVNWPARPFLQTYQYDDPTADKYNAGGSSCQAEAIAAITDRQKAARKQDACAEAADSHKHNTQDLIQQTRAASAAEAQADIAAQALWMTFVQTIGGWLTMIAAIAAAFYARDAAIAGRETHRATIVFEDGFFVLEAENCGKVNTQSAGYTGIIFSFDLYAINIGRSPLLLRRLTIDGTEIERDTLIAVGARGLIGDRMEIKAPAYGDFPCTAIYSTSIWEVVEYSFVIKITAEGGFGTGIRATSGTLKHITKRE
ncbi:hypothetical protein WP12_05835 [Sphingomonas sp. SRS2]|nr:hypothetical protein WP12_05835 [Sphingomonas sp. SRS2]